MAKEQDLLRKLFDAMPQLGWTAGPDGFIDYYNPRWYAYTGTTPEQMRGWGWKAVHDPGLLPDVLARWERSLATGEPFEMEFKLRRHDGEMRWFLTRVEPMRGDDGEVIRWVGINTDVHDQKLAQEALERARQLEALHRERLSRLFAQAPLPIALHEGPEHRYVLANDRARELAGGRDLVGRPLLDALPELRGQPIVEILDQVYRTGTGIQQTEALPVMVATAEGQLEERFFRVAWEPVFDVQGEVTGVMSIGVELTEQVRLREQLEVSERKAVDANRAKDEFLAMLGHELRNPLAPMRTALELINLQLPADELVRERAILARQMDHLVRMVDDLLDIARVTGGKLTLNREVLDLADVLAEALETASPLLESKRHHVSVQLAPGVYTLDADPVRLAQVFTNLLVNAAKYTPDRGRIVVWAEAEEGSVTVFVRDDGDGLTGEFVQSLFEPFVQSPQSIARSGGGLGLGLAIARNIVEQHGGNVTATSEGLGRGSTFAVQLPLLPAEAGAIPRRQRISRPTPPLPAEETRRVMVVDDNEDAAEMLCARLVRRGFEVHIAHDGRSALDIGLPEMDGYELARRLRDSIDPTPLLIAVTGYGQQADKVRAKEVGFDHHFTKPVDFEEILALLQPRLSDVD